MKTHKIALILEKLAYILRQEPNVDLNEATIGDKATKLESRGQIELGLDTLLALSQISKPQWMQFISEYGFQVDTRPRDSSSNILGKLLKYLKEHPEARRQIQQNIVKSGVVPSEAIMRALSTLLKED